MNGGWRDTVLQLMRVPRDPSPPPGSPPQVFRAAANYFVLRLIEWIAINLILLAASLTLITVAIGFLPADTPQTGKILVGFVAGAVTLLLLLRLTLGYAIMRLDYELRWYMISDRAIRIREGILTVREKTIALANIQNTVIRQGPIQRLLGIADVEVRTAGGGSSEAEKAHGQGLAEPMHVGYFRGVDNAAQLRSVILEGVRRHRDAGLGDPEDARHDDSAKLLLAETRLLREMLEKVAGSG